MTTLNPQFNIGDKRVGGGATPYVIAEAGSNFNQSKDQALRLIDTAADAGADAATQRDAETERRRCRRRALELA